jgi:hypothetical protein
LENKVVFVTLQIVGTWELESSTNFTEFMAALGELTVLWNLGTGVLYKLYGIHGCIR